MNKEAEVIRINDLTRKGMFCIANFNWLIKKIFKNLSNPSVLKEVKTEMIDTIEKFFNERIEEIEEIDKL